MPSVLLDKNIPWGVRRHLAGHTVRTTEDEGWSDLSNGDLLAQTTVPATGGAVNVRFSAAYVAADAAKIKPGIANASLPFTLTYE